MGRLAIATVRESKIRPQFWRTRGRRNERLPFFYGAPARATETPLNRPWAGLKRHNNNKHVCRKSFHGLAPRGYYQTPRWGWTK